MKLTPHKLSQEQAKEIANWKYPAEYAIYNLPPWEKMVEENYSLTDEVKRERFIAYTNEEGELIGFVNLLDEGGHVFFGIGVKPDACNQGIGKVITKMALTESQTRFPKKPVVLEVRTWNKRAIQCYQSQGFTIVETKKQETYIGLGEFYVMRYEPTAF